ncbi:hypothetical protein K450DRAFT_262590 [Umbelopsis ramanniana AG]|uniref:Uncharacterized protein n=1 Tax=Umbelopsis ramanniana AG TaxID=1314678 RepID=A0AAD5H7K2_UMBRA|nr:uncharacterized protein K450DRAFT_262590 [Umbelopsis ramanniana AG]KAI8575280.1 hypothetical protein K450DRAFT_262590 [Umbelopsis ramanniana AG]
MKTERTPVDTEALFFSVTIAFCLYPPPQIHTLLLVTRFLNEPHTVSPKISPYHSKEPISLSRTSKAYWREIWNNMGGFSLALSLSTPQEVVKTTVL